MLAGLFASVLAGLMATGCEFDATSPAMLAGQPSATEVAEARERLAGLVIQPAGPMAGYDRALFPHWSTATGACNTRETVLTEQGDGVRTNEDCEPIAGSWTSPYDGATWTDASDIDIDHVVPLAEAWRSGASEWTVAKRKLFANDLDNPQLIAVTDNENSAKGDQDPSEWAPPLRSYWCAYAAMWVEVKTAWDLTADPGERDALTGMLDTCPAGAP